MKDSDGLLGTSRASYPVFTAVKYLVYALLSFNVYLFLQEELSALEHTFVDGFEAGQIVQVFSATIDTTADLTDEIAIVRLALRRLVAHLDDDLTLDDMVALARILLRGASRVARLLETQRTIFGASSSSAITRTIDQAIAELGQPGSIDQ